MDCFPLPKNYHKRSNLSEKDSIRNSLTLVNFINMPQGLKIGKVLGGGELTTVTIYGEISIACMIMIQDTNVSSIVIVEKIFNQFLFF